MKTNIAETGETWELCETCEFKNLSENVNFQEKPVCLKINLKLGKLMRRSPSVIFEEIFSSFSFQFFSSIFSDIQLNFFYHDTYFSKSIFFFISFGFIFYHFFVLPFDLITHYYEPHRFKISVFSDRMFPFLNFILSHFNIFIPLFQVFISIFLR